MVKSCALLKKWVFERLSLAWPRFPYLKMNHIESNARRTNRYSVVVAHSQPFGVPLLELQEH